MERALGTRQQSRVGPLDQGVRHLDQEKSGPPLTIGPVESSVTICQIGTPAAKP